MSITKANATFKEWVREVEQLARKGGFFVPPPPLKNAWVKLWKPLYNRGLNPNEAMFKAHADSTD